MNKMNLNAEYKDFDTEFGRAKNWNGRWIWKQGEDTVKNSYYYFRKEFNLKEKSTGYRIYATADTRYMLYVNGRFVGRGIPQTQPYHQYYNLHEVDGFVTEGVNCIAFVVNYIGNIPGSRGGLLAELVDGNGIVLTATNESWKVQRAIAWNDKTYYFSMSQYSPYQEVYDAGKAPEGWKEAGFDDIRWENACVIKGMDNSTPPSVNPWSFLLPRDIPYMIERDCLPVAIEKVEENIDIMNRNRGEDLSIALSFPGNPIRYSRVEAVENLIREEGITYIANSTHHMDHIFDGVYAPSVIVDFGRIVNAYIRLDMEGVKGGIVDIGYAERLFDGHFNNTIECQFADRYIMTEGRQTFESFTWKAFRYIKLQFRNCFKRVVIHTVKALLTEYPYEQMGGFISSDSKLNRLFEISRDTIKLCSNEFLCDTPWREQAQFLGDVSAVTLGGIYSCFGDTVLPAKFLRQCAANQQPTGFMTNITNSIFGSWDRCNADFNLWWLIALWKHYRYTGEEYWIHRYYPHAIKLTFAMLQYMDESCLVKDTPNKPFIDWADIDRRGKCAPLNAMLYHALECAVKMAEIKNDSYTAEYLTRVRNTMKKSFVETFFNEELGVFADANIEGALSEKISEHTNCAAILWGLVDNETAGKIVELLYEKKSVHYTEAQPFFSAVVLQALDKLGRSDLCFNEVLDRWIVRMVDRGASSTYEEWGFNGTWRHGNHFAGVLRTQSHAWSAFPAEFLIRYMIGFEIMEPGCGKIKITPRLVKFDYEVKCPVPQGIVKVIKQGSDIQVIAPDGVEVIRQG